MVHYYSTINFRFSMQWDSWS